MNDEKLIPVHGGYRNLKGFQVAQLAYDITVRFCDKYIDRFSRTRDQMIQAARSGVQNIVEGSQAAGTSKKTELKLTNVARASLEELKLDYEDYLRQHNLELWAKDDPLRKQLVAKRCKTANEVATWIISVRDEPYGEQHGHEKNIKSKKSIDAEIAANATLVLVGVACSLLSRQIETLAEQFTNEGGFTERLYRVRKNHRTN